MYLINLSLLEESPGGSVSKEYVCNAGDLDSIPGSGRYPSDLALQISNLLVFDFLLNNWDRYSGTRAFWGVNCQFSHGRFMSIDNGAALSQTPHPKPERHLRGIRRFSRLTYEAIGALDHDRTLARLYPNATDQEKDRFETFWKQRGKYLNYIQSLVAEYGETEVLFFD